MLEYLCIQVILGSQSRHIKTKNFIMWEQRDVLIIAHASSKSLCNVLVLSNIFICLSVTISLIRSERGRRSSRERTREKMERCCWWCSHNTIPHRRLGFWLLLASTSFFRLTISHFLILSLILFFCSLLSFHQIFFFYLLCSENVIKITFMKVFHSF